MKCYCITHIKSLLQMRGKNDFIPLKLRLVPNIKAAGVCLPLSPGPETVARLSQGRIR